MWGEALQSGAMLYRIFQMFLSSQLLVLNSVTKYFVISNARSRERESLKRV